MSVDLQNLSVLYIEDDELSREIVNIILGRVLPIKNLWVWETSEGFMERIEALPVVPDLVLLDIQMEPHNGFTILKALRDDPRYAGITVVAITASVMNEQINRLRDAGFDAAIGKPLDADSFPRLLTEIISGKSIWYIFGAM